MPARFGPRVVSRSGRRGQALLARLTGVRNTPSESRFRRSACPVWHSAALTSAHFTIEDRERAARRQEVTGRKLGPALIAGARWSRGLPAPLRVCILGLRASSLALHPL